MSEPLHHQPAVVLCEAYESLREGLETVLQGHYRVTSARRLTELPPLLETVTPSILIVDVDDQSEPYEALRRIRETCKTTPILLLSREFSLEQQLEAVQQFGNVGFVTKPFSLEPLLEKIETLIQGYSSAPIRRRIVRVAQ